MKPLITKITTKRRVTIPAQIREHMGVHPGDVIEWERDGEHWLMFRIDPDTDQPSRDHFATATPIDGDGQRYIVWAAQSHAD